MNDTTELLRVKEVAKILHIGKNKTYSLVSKGVISGFKSESTWLVPRKSVDEYIQRCIDKTQKEIEDKRNSELIVPAILVSNDIL